MSQTRSASKRYLASLFAVVVLLTIIIFRSQWWNPQAQKFSPGVLLERFYREYFLDAGQGHAGHSHLPDLPFSKSFQELLDKNGEVCELKAGDDICGWGADGDIYLDAQEVEPGITFESAGTQITTITPVEVKVTFNVYPSAKNSQKIYQREITYRFIQENGDWVVDDLVVRGKSSRELIAEETARFENSKK